MRETNFLTENNARYLWHPMVSPADARQDLPWIIVGSEGCEVIDVEGHRVLDAVGGLWNVTLGYSCDPIKKAIADQLQALPYYSTFKVTSNAPVIELSYKLAQWFAPDGLVRSFFTSGGSDSVESCLRLARQFHRANGQPERTKFISLRKGYHGTHFGGASVNGNTVFRRAYEPHLPGVFHIPAPDVYRNPFGTADAEQVSGLCAALLEEEIVFQGPDTVAAFIMEPVLGAGGVIVPPASFMPKVREICDRHGVLLIADEVITGFGRTGHWSGSRMWGVRPDLMSTAKAITGGYFPFGAVLVGERIAAVLEAEGRPFTTISHGYTYSGHPVGAAAAVAAMAEGKRLDVAANAAARGAELHAGLERLKTKHEVIGDVRGIGLMAAIEFVSDRQAKTPAPAALAERVQKQAYRGGVMVRASGNKIILSPPLVVTEADIRRIVDTLDTALAASN